MIFEKDFYINKQQTGRKYFHNRPKYKVLISDIENRKENSLDIDSFSKQKWKFNFIFYYHKI